MDSVRGGPFGQIFRPDNFVFGMYVFFGIYNYLCLLCKTIKIEVFWSILFKSGIYKYLILDIVLLLEWMKEYKFIDYFAIRG